ncbi:MAG: DUF2088 domain-containing protein [Planctomycetes bacterium]|nr:DUF2088 domain-containing protein [Planctomycetota bacterium]
MSRSNGSNNIHTVTADDPPFLFHRGEGYTRHRLPVDSKVIYPNDPLEPVPDRRAAIENALDHPLGSDPLDALLAPGMKVTIAFDDVSLPLPRMAKPDIRQTVVEIVLERLDKAGVTDVELICAICLHRRITPAEMTHMLGKEIYRRFAPKKLYNHDAEDPEGNVDLGTTSTGEVVEINRRAAESDLIIYVNINMVTMDGGHKSVPVGLATYRSVAHHHSANMLLHDSSYMDPPNSSFHRSCERMGAVVAKHVKIFTIETTLNGNLFSNLLGFLQRREHAWNILDRLNYHGSRIGLGLLSGTLRRKVYNALPAPYGMTGVHAGDTELVHQQTLINVDRQHAVEVPEQFDVMLVGLPSIGPYNVDSVLNPILVQCLSAGYFFNFYRNRPLVRRGGVMIVEHPVENRFKMLHHPSYHDFFEDLLPQTRDPRELETRFERSYAENERYIDLYRNSYAYHGVHPFYMWYWGAHGMAHLKKVIVVNPVSELAARRIGFEVAPSMDAALSMAQDTVGPSAKIAYFHCPPVMMCHLP